MLVSVVLFVACSGGEGGEGGTGGSAAGGAGSGGAAGSSGAAGSGGGTCAPSGTYALTITRDTIAPGSCPNSLVHPGNATATITASGGGDYTMKVDDDSVCVGDCTVNVTGCKLTATCKQCTVIASSGYGFDATEEWTLTNTGLAGTEKWPAYPSKPACSANWVVTGVRQ